MVRFEIFVHSALRDRFDAVFRRFVEAAAPEGDAAIHQVSFEVAGGERRIVMFETEAQRARFAAAWAAATPSAPEAWGGAKSYEITRSWSRDAARAEHAQSRAF